MSDGESVEPGIEPHEHKEHAEHAAHSGDPFIIKVSATIAILAVLAAGVSSLETVESGFATEALSEANLFQNKATDSWSHYQAERLKKTIYDVLAIQSPDKAGDARKQAQHYDEGSRAIAEDARKLEETVDAREKDSAMHEARHHRLTIAATLLHVGIAISTIAIIAKGQRWPWYAAVTLGYAGIAVALSAYAIH